MKTYAEQLKDPRWQKKRLEIMERDGFACQCCGDTENTLNVHHKKYLRGKNVFDYPDEILITLCENCHLKIQKNIDLIIEHLDSHIYCGGDDVICVTKLLSFINFYELQYFKDILMYVFILYSAMHKDNSVLIKKLDSSGCDFFEDKINANE